jgi:hypothetical protein
VPVVARLASGTPDWQRSTYLLPAAFFSKSIC